MDKENQTKCKTVDAESMKVHDELNLVIGLGLFLWEHWCLR